MRNYATIGDLFRCSLESGWHHANDFVGELKCSLSGLGPGVRQTAYSSTALEQPGFHSRHRSRLGGTETFDRHGVGVFLHPRRCWWLVRHQQTRNDDGIRARFDTVAAKSSRVA